MRFAVLGGAPPLDPAIAWLFLGLGCRFSRDTE